MRRDRDRLRAALLVVGAVFFGALGQFYLIGRRDYVWDAVIFFGVALICFVWLMVVAARTVRADGRRSPPDWRARGRRVLIDRRAIPFVVALLLNWLAARSVNSRPPPDDFSFSILLWLPQYLGWFALPTAFRALDWHIHEMLYGYVAATIAGFLLTAIPNWTGQLPLNFA